MNSPREISKRDHDDQGVGLAGGKPTGMSEAGKSNDLSALHREDQLQQGFSFSWGE